MDCLEGRQVRFRKTHGLRRFHTAGHLNELIGAYLCVASIPAVFNERDDPVSVTQAKLRFSLPVDSFYFPDQVNTRNKREAELTFSPPLTSSDATI